MMPDAAGLDRVGQGIEDVTIPEAANALSSVASTKLAVARLIHAEGAIGTARADVAHDRKCIFKKQRKSHPIPPIQSDG